ncbi:peptidase C39 family protein [Microtetraspora fusca]|uniref:peptidase C39 family protein n=1 Tax=Microtetraspora fusca TaxID=1997 RepID=UPI000A05FD8E|nr:peptidase C39 family protein [Microtetraspora fusca]
MSERVVHPTHAGARLDEPGRIAAGHGDGLVVAARAVDGLDIAVLPVHGDVGQVAEGLLDHVPEETLRHWRLAGGIQVRTLVTARVDGVLVGAAFEVHRPLTAYRKIVDVWAPDERVADLLVETIEERAWREGAVAVKRWFAAKDSEHDELGGALEDLDGSTGRPAGDPADPGNPAAAGKSAWRRSLERGYREAPVPVWAAPVTADPADTGYGQVRWRGAAPDRALPYMRQTTDFTCGPVALQLALCGLGLQDQPDRGEEMRMWRQATTVAGCDPLGLALAAADRGAVPEVLLSTEQPTLLELCTTDEERDLRRFIQSGFRADLAERGITVETTVFDLDRLRAVLADGAIALVLIEQLGMHAEPSPHWITVHSVDGDIFYANDPWTDADLGETYLDALDLPLPSATLDRLAWYGTPSYRSMVVLRAA